MEKKRLTYGEKLKDPRWQRLRLEVFQRDDFTCVRCKRSSISLHIHHKKYFQNAEPWEYDPAFLETLCEDCHRITHQQIAEPKYKAEIDAMIENDQSFITAADTQIKILMNSLSKGVPSDVEDEILKNIMYLQQKIKAYKADK